MEKGERLAVFCGAASKKMRPCIFYRAKSKLQVANTHTPLMPTARIIYLQPCSVDVVQPPLLRALERNISGP